MSKDFKVAVIGGGAAGFFSAISVKENYPDAQVTIFEKTKQVLAKVRISGGGRCNVTHHEFNIKKLATHYPRGEKFLRKAFSQFSVQDTIDWFGKSGVELKVEEDGRMFPVSNKSESIVNALNGAVIKHGIDIQFKKEFVDLEESDQGNILTFSDGEKKEFTHVIIALGGQKRRERYELFERLGHEIKDPVASLFTFNLKDRITSLMGTVVPEVQVKIQGTKLTNTGPVLITHWGVSGPGVLKLSSIAARELAEKNYHFTVVLNWLNQTEDKARAVLNSFIQTNGRKLVNKKPFEIPNRLWTFVMENLQLDTNKTWDSIDKKSKNRLINKLVNDQYPVTEKTTFKEEFVICGGIALSSIQAQTMESKSIPGLFFVGEYLDIDGVTGGFNFQSAWTTGHIAGKLGNKDL